MKPRHVEDVEIDYDKIPHMMNLVIVKEMLEKMQRILTAINLEPDSAFDGLCKQMSKNIRTINGAIDIVGITDDIIKHQDLFTANRDHKKTDNQKKCIESFKIN